MKHPTFRGLLRLAAFLLGLALIVAFANTFCIKTDIYAALTMAEVKTRSDIEVAFVGSSIVRDHFNAEMISKEIGKTCFALGIPCGMLQGNISQSAVSQSIKTLERKLGGHRGAIRSAALPFLPV